MIVVYGPPTEAVGRLRAAGLSAELLETVGETQVIRVTDGDGTSITIRTRLAGPTLVENVWRAIDMARKERTP